MDTVRLTDMKASYDVNFTNAAYIYVSCRITSLDEKSSDNYPKCPWIRLICHFNTYCVIYLLGYQITEQRT